MHYDKLVVAIGSTSNTFGTEGVADNCIMMKDIHDGVNVRSRVFEQFETATLPLLSPKDAAGRCLTEDEIQAKRTMTSTSFWRISLFPSLTLYHTARAV